MKKLFAYFVIMMVLFGILPGHKAAATSTLPLEPQLQVKLVNYLGNQPSITLNIAGNYYLNGTSHLLIGGKSYSIKVQNGSLSLYNGNTKLAAADTLSITPVNSSEQAVINNRSYNGGFKFTVENNQYVRPINVIYMEDYIKSVVPSEMYASWSKEALKSQADAARTYAYFRLNKIIDDTTYNQVYGGVNTLNANTTAAVQETTGELITYNGSPIEAVFSASNGGMTENNYNEFGTAPLPYFPIKSDSYDTKFDWNFSLKKQQINVTGLDLSQPDKWWNQTNEADQAISTTIKAWLNKNGYLNKQLKIVSIPKVAFYAKTESGRVSRGDISIEFLVKDKRDSSGKLAPQKLDLTNTIADKIRAMIGTTVMKSNLISNMTETTDSYSISGKGYGHGVGLSQYGANNRATAGFKHLDILSFYYPGTVVSKKYSAVDRTKRTIGWVKAGTAWYYLDSTGKVKTGWIYSGSKWYYLDQNGVMKTGWVKVGTTWYYLDSSGAMKTGWLKLGSTWYYLDSSGAMKTGWVQAGGKWYYFYSNGSMAYSTVIGGYRLGADGARIR
ncbi:SpoIID/LytB domain-containing protein [Neobacillus sp. NRS-1170]|uniref:SpoIID/LytB domain-containing protein n=1 Tax=Neobacillus sp. NRS-1170 TaxID=3233898 RepID=UPI003D293C34